MFRRGQNFHPSDNGGEKLVIKLLTRKQDKGSKRVSEEAAPSKQRARAEPIFNVKMQLNLFLGATSTTEKM